MEKLFQQTLITLFSIKLTEKLTVNQTTLTALTLMGGSVTLLLGTNSAQAALIYDNIGAPLDGSNAMNISDFAMADDFTVTEAVDLTDFTFWAFGLDNDSDLSDSIGWAIFNNNPGAVGSLIASGTDSTVTKTDTGLDSVLGANILRVDGDFGSTINLTAGTYWISFRDGAWGSAFDGTSAFWTFSQASIVGSQPRSDFDEVNPTFPNRNNGSRNFQLFDNSDVATTPEPGTLLGLLAVGSIGALIRRKIG